MHKLMIANRGEIAIRIARGAGELGITSVAIYAEDDAQSLHVELCDEAIALNGRGASAYLDIEAIVSQAVSAGCDAVHPGYGFLSENPSFAAAVEAAGMVFVGPTTQSLSVFGDKAQARALAEANGVPVLDGVSQSVSEAEAAAFFASHADGGVLLKAIAGGGGRGMRIVRSADELPDAYARCVSEATAAFGDGTVYVEQLVDQARHIEVQVIGDGSGPVSHLGERECSVQRRHQKLIEIAPSPALAAETRQMLCDDAVKLAKAIKYRGLGTIEFLLDQRTGQHYFIEANARLQVEHTVTEEVTGVDLVRAQLEIASGSTLADLNLTQASVPPSRGYAIQLRVNTETVTPSGEFKPTGGRLTQFSVPTGPGLRTDTYGYLGYTTNPNYDSLLAKLICYSPSPDYQDAVIRAQRGLKDFAVGGVATNLPLLQAIVAGEVFQQNQFTTRYLDDHLMAFAGASNVDNASGTGPAQPGAQVNSNDPLAVLEHGKSGVASSESKAADVELMPEHIGEGEAAIAAPMQGTVVAFEVQPGDEVYAGKLVLVMEAMKMEHEVRAELSGVVERLGVAAGDTVFEGHPLIVLRRQEVAAADEDESEELDLDYIRPDLQEVFDRKGAGLDENRPEAVAKRHKTGRRTARENVADLCDEGTFVEYGSVVVAGQRRRRSMEDLIKNTTGDGMVAGLGQINGDLFAEDQSRAMIMSYDYMVLAGTQGMKNHDKKDRLFEVAEQFKLPVVLFAEGGGGRPGDTDGSGVAGLDCLAFTYFAKLSGLVPTVGITTGRCFAGNAVLLGCCDVIIATQGSNIGIGGPAMIEGGGLGVFTPDEVGPMDVQVPNGVVDIEVADEAEAVVRAKQYLSYFQGPVDTWEAPDPESFDSWCRRIVYVITTCAR